MSRPGDPGVFVADSSRTLLAERWLFLGVYFLAIVPGSISIIFSNQWPSDWSTGNRAVDVTLLMASLVGGAFLMILAVPAMTYQKPLDLTGGVMNIPFWARDRLPVRVATIKLEEVAVCKIASRRAGADTFLVMEMLDGRSFRFYVEWLSRYHDSQGNGFVDWLLLEFGTAGGRNADR